jgi:CHASE3 domain sensor protein
VTAPNLREASLDQLLAALQPLSALGISDTQVRAIMSVIAKCSLDLTDGLVGAATEAGTLTQQLVRLNRSLTWATWVIAGGTVLLVLVAILTAHSAP